MHNLIGSPQEFALLPSSLDRRIGLLVTTLGTGMFLRRATCGSRASP